MIRKVIVVGGGSAGLMAAVALKSKLPALDVGVIRSPEIGIIGVGEGSTVALTSFLHEYLRVPEKVFFDLARPTFKLGLRMHWGSRPYFNYHFDAGPEQRVDDQLPLPAGFYAWENLEYIDPISAMMTHDRAFERGSAGPKLHRSFAYHFENERFVQFLESHARALGVVIQDDTVVEVLRGEQGVAHLALGSGQAASADLYLDCSGFRSLLLGKALGEQFIDFSSSLFCDRAVIGGWQRLPDDRNIKPYTTCDTMESGWSWQIEHEDRVNRGYVYGSAFISDAAAEREFLNKNPRLAAGQTRIVRFASGRYQSNWVGNVVAIGNASGFVEPLEATALGVIALQARDIVQTLIESECRPSQTQRMAYNLVNARRWENIRRFLAVHYRFNTRVDTPFWRECRERTDLAGAEPIVQYYRENGPASYWAPTLFDSHDQFGFGGYCTLLLGQNVPFDRARPLTEPERKIWDSRRRANHESALRAMTVRESLDRIHSKTWMWHSR